MIKRRARPEGHEDEKVHNSTFIFSGHAAMATKRKERDKSNDRKNMRQ